MKFNINHIDIPLLTLSIHFQLYLTWAPLVFMWFLWFQFGWFNLVDWQHFSWLYANNKIKSTDLYNARIISRQNNSCKPSMRDSIAIIMGQNDICNDNVCFIIPNICINVLKLTYTRPPFFCYSDVMRLIFFSLH